MIIYGVKVRGIVSVKMIVFKRKKVRGNNFDNKNCTPYPIYFDVNYNN